MQREIKRLFIAVDIAVAVRDDLSSQVYKKGSFGRASWVKPENYHLTLKFLGDTDPGDITKIAKIIEEAAAGKGEVTLTFNELGLFKNLARPKVIWAGFSDVGGVLGKIAGELDEKLSVRLGVPMERRAFKPHLTLARIKGDPDRIKLSGFIKHRVNLLENSFKVSEIVLYESELMKTGAVYTRVKSASLK